jgi:hypothetical protein
MNIYLILKHRTTAASFNTQILELKRVMTDFKSNTKNKPLSLLDLDSRLFSNYLIFYS